MIYILGFNSFIAKNFYLFLKNKRKDIILLNHIEIKRLKNINDNDVLINFCGVNRSNNKEDYINGNFKIIKEIINYIKNKDVYFIHISSLMVNGFKSKKIDELNNYQKWFIDSKLKGEEYIKNNYSNYIILRPSNIYGFNCKPYYNNLLCSLVYEKNNNLNKYNNLNKNCIRNHLSVNGLSNFLIKIIENKKNGIYNILSNNNINLEELIYLIYDEKPENIIISDGEYNEINNVNADNIIIDENLKENIDKLILDMKIYQKLKENVLVKNLNSLDQSRGSMVEISNLNSKRLYKITLTQHSVRGNHFHYKQIEDFYTNSGKVTYLLAYSEYPDIILNITSNKNDFIRVIPNIIHTLTNDFLDNIPEIIISSTQEFIANSIPDTKYVNLIS